MISIHPPRAGRDGIYMYKIVGVLISIHPPRAGRDHNQGQRLQLPQGFQSTRPVRGGTLMLILILSSKFISIHPPRAGRDTITPKRPTITYDFNPPAPCGAGRQPPYHHQCEQAFQSTRPVRGGTIRGCIPNNMSRYFNPPAPCGAGPELRSSGAPS